MATRLLICSTAAAALALAAAVSGTAAATCGSARAVASTGSALAVTSARGLPSQLPAAYEWPLKPFDRQHPVRANLDDPRIGHEGGEAFHFGIDIAAPDGTAVYAVAPGTAYVSKRAVAVALDSARVFGYWHIVPAVSNRQHVTLHQLLGHIARGWEHVHFAERSAGIYRNPLRPGGIGPYDDATAPHVAEIALAQTSPGAFRIVADAYDTPSLRVPGAWADEPVSPALIRWRLVSRGGGGTWRTAADFRSRMLDRSRFGSVYAPETQQNHKGAPGRFCYVLAPAWRPADGAYRLDVTVADTRGNRSTATTWFDVVGGQISSPALSRTPAGRSV